MVTQPLFKMKSVEKLSETLTAELIDIFKIEREDAIRLTDILDDLIDAKISLARYDFMDEVNKRGIYDPDY